MLRNAAMRALVRPTARVARPLSSSASLLVKIRSSAPPPTASSTSTTARNNKPSPAERPSDVPGSVTTPPPFEPTVHRPADPTPISKQSPIPELGSTAAASSSYPQPPPTVPIEGTEGAESDIATPFDRSKLPSLDIDPEAAIEAPKPDEHEGGKRERTGAGRKEYISSIERQRRTMLRLALVALGLGGLGAVWFLGNEDANKLATAEEGTLTGRYERFKNNLSELTDVFNKPAFKVLLPDALPPPHQRPYTLVVDLEGLLVSSSWDRQHGWRTAKRPGLDYFLAYLSQFYEIVLFTSQPLYASMGVAEKIDPWGAFIPYKLFREATRYVDGKVVKDLSFLNRDLSKVILLDTNPEHAHLQPENSVIIKPWTGAPGDQGLIDMVPFLEAIGIYNVKDVRPILQSYAGKDIPVEYAKKEAAEKRKVVEEWEASRASTGSGSSWLSNAFGSVAAPGASRPNQPMTYLEQKRAFFQQAYREEQKYWRDHADEFNKMIEEDKKRQLQEMRGSLLGWMTGQKKEDKPSSEGKI